MSSRGRLDSAISRGRAFVEAHGAADAQLRVRLLLGDAPPRDLERWLEERQDPSGGLAPFEGDAGVLGSTATALEWLADLQLLGLPCAERAACRVAASQRADGSFAATQDAEPEARLQHTGRLAPVLARMACVSLDRLEALGGFLAAQWSVERAQRGRYRDLAPFLPFFAIHPHELSDAALQWCGRELERSFRCGRLSPLESARLFVRSDARSLPGTRVEGREIAWALLADQRPDGGFAVEDAEIQTRVEDSLDALLALVRLA